MKFVLLPTNKILLEPFVKINFVRATKTIIYTKWRYRQFAVLCTQLE